MLNTERKEKTPSLVGALLKALSGCGVEKKSISPTQQILTEFINEVIVVATGINNQLHS
jgi:hypothetical protein